MHSLENQQVNEFAYNLALANEQWFKEIEGKFKSLKKLTIFYSSYNDYNSDLLYGYHDYHIYQQSVDRLNNNHYSCINLTSEQKQQQLNYCNQKIEELKQKFDKEVMERLQKFIDQNVNLTHLAIQQVGNAGLPKELCFDFSKLTKLVFLSTLISYDKEMNLKNNKELEVLWLAGSTHYPNDFYKNSPIVNRLDLKENKKLKCLAFDRANLYSLNLRENKELEYIDIRQTKISYLDLKDNEKITIRDKE